MILDASTCGASVPRRPSVTPQASMDDKVLFSSTGADDQWRVLRRTHLYAKARCHALQVQGFDEVTRLEYGQ